MSTSMCITVTGLEEIELHGGTILLVSAPYLCIVVGGVNVESKTIDYVLIMNKQENADLIRYLNLLPSPRKITINTSFIERQ